MERLLPDDIEDFLLPCMNIHCYAFLFNARRLSSIPFALGPVMSRVEPMERPEPREAERKPSQAEGEERDVDEALNRQEEKRPEE